MTQQTFLDALQSYESISNLLKTYSHEEILTVAAEVANISPQQLANHPMGGYSKGKTNGCYYFVLQDCIRNISHYDWLYRKLEDDLSKQVFTNLMRYRMIPANQFLKAAYASDHHQYFDHRIIQCDENEVFVDCGGFIGDTAEEYIAQFGTYRKIYVYEPSNDNIDTCRKNLKKYKNVTVRQCGVGEKHEILAFSNASSAGSFVAAEADTQADQIEIISLDTDIQEPVSFIKMDIEGFEIPALLGAKRHIQQDTPKLAICTYHIVSDLWEIPRLIDHINPNYTFHLRHYHDTQNWETVVYAIPKSKAIQNTVIPLTQSARPDGGGAKKRIVALAPSGWFNAHLVKDCGVIPYLLCKNHNCEAVMVGAKMEESYSNLQYVPGLQMEFLEDPSYDTRLQYIEQNAWQIDGLILYGCYWKKDEYGDIPLSYKKQNPKGKIYLALDANSGWMDRIPWDTVPFHDFMNACDVVATSCRVMVNHLNEKWYPWKIEYIPNGFYDFTGNYAYPDLSKKENIILTVGRLGTKQKQTQVLMESFVQIASSLPNWKMYLAGSIDPSFLGYQEEFFLKYPDMKDRIIFLGNLVSREELYEQYQRAKIFALPSTWEGGAPNVIAEALHFGCAIAITKIDAYTDAVDNGRCGLSAEIRDIDDFANILKQLCVHPNLGQMMQHALTYGHYQFDMEQIAARLYHMLFEEES